SYTGYQPYNIPKGAVNKVETAKWRYITAVIYNPILGLIKISFLLTLIKLCSPNLWINGSLWTIFSINVAFTIAAPIAAAFQCVPVPHFWDPINKPGKCIDKKQYIYSTIIVTIITDVLVLIMPTWILYDLHMPRKNKITIAAFLSLGLAVTAIAAYRLAFFVQVFSLKSPMAESPYSIRTALSNLESNLAVIATCGPTIKWLLGTCIPFFDSS
ncbi:hypothetical protein K469DRAFT_463794, partial [Zopfia rhizophila CBS 207.26]